MAMKDYTDFILNLGQRIKNKKLFDKIYEQMNSCYNNISDIKVTEHNFEVKTYPTSKDVEFAIYMGDDKVKVIDNYNNKYYEFISNDDKDEIYFKNINNLNTDTSYYYFENKKLVCEKHIKKSNTCVNPGYTIKHYNDHNVITYNMDYVENAYADPYNFEYLYGTVENELTMDNFNQEDLISVLKHTTKDNYIHELNYKYKKAN